MGFLTLHIITNHLKLLSAPFTALLTCANPTVTRATVYDIYRKRYQTNVAQKINLKMLDFLNFDVFDITFRTSMLFYA